MSKIKTIGILTSGGDAPGMNAAIRAVTRVGAIEAIKQGQRNIMVGIRNNEVVYVPFSECIRTDKRFDKSLITVLNELSI